MRERRYMKTALCGLVAGLALVTGAGMHPEGKIWDFLMQQKDQTGKWTTFAEDTLRRSS